MQGYIAKYTKDPSIVSGSVSTEFNDIASRGNQSSSLGDITPISDKPRIAAINQMRRTP